MSLASKNYVEHEVYEQMAVDVIYDSSVLLTAILKNAISDLSSSDVELRAWAFFYLCGKSSDLYSELLPRYSLEDVNVSYIYKRIQIMAINETEMTKKSIVLPKERISKAACVKLEENSYLFYPVFTDGPVNKETALKIVGWAKLNGMSIDMLSEEDDVPQELQIRIHQKPLRETKDIEDMRRHMSRQIMFNTFEFSSEKLMSVEESRKAAALLSSSRFLGQSPVIRTAVQTRNL